MNKVDETKPTGDTDLECGDTLPGSVLVIMANEVEVLSVSGPTVGAWQSLASFGRAQYMTADQQQAAAQFETALLGGNQPVGHAVRIEASVKHTLGIP